jgi:Rieske Fe-S protein
LNVKFYADDIEIGRLNTSPYTFEWNTTYEKEGKHIIKATAENDKRSSNSNEIEIRLIQGIIPKVEVEIFKHLYSPPIFEMENGESIVIEGGHSGIIIYRDSTFHFTAFDRTCTLWPNHTEAVVHDTLSENNLYSCPYCNSKFLHRSDGKVLSGPAQYPLVKYKTVVNRNTLYIYNPYPS